jgi:CBS domain-containing protein
MAGGEPIQRVRIYLNERDIQEGQSLYIAVLERLRREGATGATALRGAAGFGPGHRSRAAGPISVSETHPIVIEWVDRVERIARVLPLLDDLLAEALVTVEELLAYRARLRSSGPFGGQVVGEVMRNDLVALAPSTPVRDAVQLMLDREQDVLPVVDDQQHPLAMITSADLELRAGLALPLRVARVLTPAERADLLATLGGMPLGELVIDEPRTAYIQSGIPQVVGTLIEWGLEALPVIDRDARLVGVIGAEQALQSVINAQAPADGAVRDAEPPPPVRLLMQTSVPTIPAAAPCARALQMVLAAPEHFLVVVDHGVPVGTIDDASVLRVLENPLRQDWLQALREPASARLEGAPAAMTAADLATPPPTIAELATQHQAIASMIKHNHTRLVVVDNDRRLVGLIGRRAILRSLVQESMG